MTRDSEKQALNLSCHQKKFSLVVSAEQHHISSYLILPHNPQKEQTTSKFTTRTFARRVRNIYLSSSPFAGHLTLVTMLSPGAIAGIVIGSIVGLIIFLVVPCFIFYRRRTSANLHSDAPVYPVAPVYPFPQESVEVGPDDAISMVGSAPTHHAPTLISHGHDPVYDPVNFGSMQVKGIRDVRGDRERGDMY